jgi:hypothetical protein
MRMEAEGGFELVNGFGGDPGSKDLMQPFERVVVSFQTADTFIHGKAGTRGIRERAEPGERRKAMERPIIRGAHDDQYAPRSGGFKHAQTGAWSLATRSLKESFANCW